MATDDPIRASDADREAVVATLREAYTAGRLTLDEFDERVTAAYAGRTWGDLRPLTVDLPVKPELGADLTDLTDLHQPASAALVPARPQPQPEPLDEASPPAGQSSRRRPVAFLIPLAVWTLLVVHGTVGPGIIFVIIVLFAVASILASIRRR